MKIDTAGSLAENIAKILEAQANPDIAALFASIEKLNHRLQKLETAAGRQDRFSAGQPLSSHPSQDHFAIAEAIADTLFERGSKEKACTYEPSKPCDHCSMCNSRGF